MIFVLFGFGSVRFGFYGSVMASVPVWFGLSSVQPVSRFKIERTTLWHIQVKFPKTWLRG